MIPKDQKNKTTQWYTNIIKMNYYNERCYLSLDYLSV